MLCGDCFQPVAACGCGAHTAAADVMTPATLNAVPNQPVTPIKCFRIPVELYVAAQVKAAERGESVSEVVRKALDRYVKRG